MMKLNNEVRKETMSEGLSLLYLQPDHIYIQRQSDDRMINTVRFRPSLKSRITRTFEWTEKTFGRCCVLGSEQAAMSLSSMVVG
jgi:hypothetical protein